jgi:hypothetical protein
MAAPTTPDILPDIPTLTRCVGRHLSAPRTPFVLPYLVKRLMMAAINFTGEGNVLPHRFRRRLTPRGPAAVPRRQRTPPHPHRAPARHRGHPAGPAAEGLRGGPCPGRAGPACPEPASHVGRARKEGPA